MRLLTAATVLMMLFAGVGMVRAYEGGGGMSLGARPSVRSLGAGETGLAETNDALAFTANAALLTWLPGPAIGAGHSDLVDGIPASAISVRAAIPLGPVVKVPGAGETGRRFGVGFSLDHGGVELSRGTDWGWNQLSLGAAYRITPYASAGLMGKYLFSNSDLEGSAVTAAGLDIGAAVEMSPAVRLALSVRNMLGFTRWEDGEDESPPLAADLGAALGLPYGTAGRVVYTFSQGAPGRLGAGIDAPVAGTGLGLRAGYVHHFGDYSRGVITAGAGYAYGGFQVDYAVNLDDDLALGTTHHFSLGYIFP